jgi:DNA-binding NarL/FixJ family response regulator
LGSIEALMSISVLVVDDHEVVRIGLVHLLTDPEIEVAGQAATGDEALRLAKETHPTVILLDVWMPDIDGLELIERIAAVSPDSRIVVLSAFDNPTYVARAITLGASNYLLKGIGREELVAAIKAAAAGDTSRQSSLWRNIEGILRSTSAITRSDAALTTREAQVLRHLALGLSNREIGRSLEISIETVKEHVQNILRKMQVIDRTQAAVEAVRQGWI